MGVLFSFSSIALLLILFLPSQNAMQIVGFMEDEVQSVLELVAAVLKLGNIEFKPESRCNGTDESRIKDKNGAFGKADSLMKASLFIL